MRYVKNITASVFAVMVGGFSSGSVFGQPYPYRPIRFIVPYAVGGAADISTRVVAPKLAESLGQQVVVDNRPGAGSIVGTELLARAPADGYTLMMANVSFSANPALHSKLPYDALKDFVPVVLVDLMPNVLLVHPSIPAKSVDELIALAKSKPGSLNYGSAGIGSANYLNTELFKNATGIDLVHIPYQGGGLIIVAQLAGEVQVVFITVPPALPHVKSGRLRGLAVTSPERIAALPDLPTIGETAVPGFVFHEWHGVLVPGGTPKQVITRLNTEINRALTAADVKQRIAAIGAEVKGSTPEQMTGHVKAEINKWAKILKRVN